MHRRVVFMGSKSAGLGCLRRLVALAPDRLVGVITLDDRADSRSALGGFATFAEELEQPLHVAKDRLHSENLLVELRPDLVFVLGWYWLIPKTVLDRVPGGFVGIHYSLLPKYRGSSPLVWQIINGEPTVGLSVFSFTETMDEGPIWAQIRVRLLESDYIADILAKLESKTEEVLADIYPGMLDGSLKPRPQRDEPATYGAARCPDDGLINWNQPARSVYNFIRAQSSPYPGAFTIYGGNKLPIWKADLLNTQYYGLPGQVVRVASEGVYVVCGDNHPLLLRTVSDQRPAQEVIRSVTTRLPSRLS